MTITVRIPTPLRSLTNEQDVVEGKGTSILELIDNLDSNYSGIKERIVDEGGNIRRFVNVFV